VAGDGRKTGKKRPSREIMVLTELEQIKVLADPLRIRILEELGEERTTMQVAERIGEKPTKLYHHVEALERVGLVELTRTQQNRGTLEKYYLAVAQAFRADARAFSAGDDATDEEKETLRTMVSTIFDTSSAELMKLFESGRGSGFIEEEGLLSFLEIRGSKEQLAALRTRLLEVVEGIAGMDERPEDEEKERFRLTLAYFPLAKDDRETETE
jgi:DNA-binding transcriptional ArsR family regulator